MNCVDLDSRAYRDVLRFWVRVVRRSCVYDRVSKESVCVVDCPPFFVRGEVLSSPRGDGSLDRLLMELE